MRQWHHMVKCGSLRRRDNGGRVARRRAQPAHPIIALEDLDAREALAARGLLDAVVPQSSAGLLPARRRAVLLPAHPKDRGAALGTGPLSEREGAHSAHPVLTSAVLLP